MWALARSTIVYLAAFGWRITVLDRRNVFLRVLHIAGDRRALGLSRHVPSQLRVRLIERHDPAETTADVPGSVRLSSRQ